MDNIELVETDVPGLRPGEEAYRVGVRTVAVRIRRRTPGETHVAWGVSARLVDPATGETCRCVAGCPAIAPERVTTLPLDFIAAGGDLTAEIDRSKKRAVQRALRVHATLSALDILPTDD